MDVGIFGLKMPTSGTWNLSCFQQSSLCSALTRIEQHWRLIDA
jgi:hypothetical protein